MRTATYARAWRRQNRRALARTGPLWVVLGDSTSQSIGATGWSRGYVSRVLAHLQADHDPAWRVVNLSQSGATAETLVLRQLPTLQELPPTSLVTCAIGINDLLGADPAPTLHYFDLLATLLAPGTLLANMPRGYDPVRSEQLNQVISRLARERGLILVDLWTHTEPHGRATLAPDQIHPSDLGYSDWAEAFGKALGLT